MYATPGTVSKTCQQLTVGYLIHVRPHNEKTQFIVLFTHQEGLVSLACSTKKVYHPFTRYQISRTGSKRSAKIEATLDAPYLFTHKKLYCALYLNELIYHFCKEKDAHPQLFIYYAESLAQLEQQKIVEPVLRRFEINLLKEAGYELSTTGIRQPYCTFSPNNGLMGCMNKAPNAIAVSELQSTLNNYTSSAEGKQFIRNIINLILSKQTKSRLFYEKIN